jgi:hypothetical protein
MQVKMGRVHALWWGVSRSLWLLESARDGWAGYVNQLITAVWQQVEREGGRR